jgi:hypothetical protein
MTTALLAVRISSRIDYFCTRHPGGIDIAVATPRRALWDSVPWPATLYSWGWVDPAPTDDHRSGVVFTYQPEIMAESVAGMSEEGVERYIDALLLYVTFSVDLLDKIADPGERRRKVEDIIYDHHPERLALLSLVQTGGGR